MFEDTAVAQVAESLYSSKLPYHNFSHVQYVLSSAERLLSQCQQESIPVDEKVVYYALLFHDAGFHENHIEKGFQTKEAYSADLAEQVLGEHGHEQDRIQQVKQAIICTHFSEPCKTNNDKAVKGADLSGLAADYDFFKDNAIKLMQEFEILNGDSIVWDKWKKLATDKLALYLKEDFSLTSDNPGNTVFTEKVHQNIERLLQDDID